MMNNIINPANIICWLIITTTKNATLAFLHVDQSGQIGPGCGLDPDMT